jgi:hypothetical protein
MQLVLLQLGDPVPGIPVRGDVEMVAVGVLAHPPPVFTATASASAAAAAAPAPARGNWAESTVVGGGTS